MAIRTALVVGGGITGLVAAAALARRGVAVELVEIRDALDDGGGVGLSVMGNATSALATIGAAEAVVAAGMPADNFTVRSHDGTVIATPPWPPLGKPAWPGQIGISRADFHRILADAAREAGARIRCGVTVGSVAQHADGAQVAFTDGRQGDFDLVIAADGLYSRTRQRLFPDAAGPQRTGLSIWRAYVPRPDGTATTQLHFDGPHGVVGVCPINAGGCYLYCLHAAPDGERQDPEWLHLALRDKLAAYGGLIPDLAAQLNDPTLVSYRPLEWLLLPRPWYRGREIVIGDAAHSNPPVIAQGAAMGIEDAVVLAAEVTAAGPLGDALARFMERRWPRVQLVVEASCNTARNQAEHTPGFNPAAEIARASRVLCGPY